LENLGTDGRVILKWMLGETVCKVKLSATPCRRLVGQEIIAPNHFWPQHCMGWVVSITPRPRFTPGERTPGTHWTGGWVGLRAGMDKEVRGKIISPMPGIEPM
jgi:hypothetical protein